MAEVMDFKVFSCSEDQFSVEAEVAGRPVLANIPGLVVELCSLDGAMTHNVRFQPADMDAAKELFTVGNIIEVAYALKGAE